MSLLEQFIKILFGRIPDFFSSKQDLREQWSDPKTREALLKNLSDGGFSKERLRQVQALTENEKCDLLDVLELKCAHLWNLFCSSISTMASTNFL